MLFNSTTNPTLTTYALIVLLSFVVLPSYGQAVNENFDGMPYSGNWFEDRRLEPDQVYNGFATTQCSTVLLNPRGGNDFPGFTRRAVGLDAKDAIPRSSLEYIGADGNGKDGGVGVISFWYRADAGNLYKFDISINVNNGGYGAPIGSIVNNLGFGSWRLFTVTVNNPNDNIKIRIQKDLSVTTGFPTFVFIDDFSITDFPLEATWTGTTWDWNDDGRDGTIPTFLDKANVFINGNYNTADPDPLQQSFGGNTLVVNSPYDLTIADDTYIEFENNITADGNIIVASKGSVVQINDSAETLGGGTITVQKETTPLNSYLEYTYWSSPVKNETIEDVFSLVPASRRYYFNAANFEDIIAEIDNTGVYNPGQDDIDDNGDDWNYASGTMEPGVGYAAMAVPAGPLAAQQFTFIGPFNNGVIEPTIYNDSGGTYSDWNFIGNPYPSAIDTEAFFTENTGLVDRIYLWNQATAASATAQGNEGENFSNADYAIITAGGLNVGRPGGEIPLNYVPSGQGFFIEALVGGPVTTVTFNNSMRVTGNNIQFFRSGSSEGSNSREALWLDLTSDNGAAKQIAIGHLEGSTDGNDGSFYDVKENLSAGNAALIYSMIPDGNNDKFVIQGKSLSSLDENEIIPIGFKSIITAPTLYKIAIAQFEGEFYNNNTIYLKDNLINTIHNLKDSDYSFTSDAGEFNERFEIVFTTDALSIDDNLLDPNALTITELTHTDVAFNVGKGFSIANVKIFDLLGRQIYDLEGSSNREVYNLAKLSKAAYIAKVTLDNGQVISKKAIKQK